MNPQSIIPMNPQSIVPSNPQSIVPRNPQSIIPINPQSIILSNPQSIIPSNPQFIIPSNAPLLLLLNRDPHISIQLAQHYATSSVHRVNFLTYSIETTVTADASVVNSWIIQTENFHESNLANLVVGLDVETRQSFTPHRNPIATIQICVGYKCLIFQVFHAGGIPNCLVDFLYLRSYTFVGIGIEEQVLQLCDDYGYRSEYIRTMHDQHGFEPGQRFVDLRILAWARLLETTRNPRAFIMLGNLMAAGLGRWDVMSMGLAQLGSLVMGIDYTGEPSCITLSPWDNPWFTANQIAYASIDAFMSFETGRLLRAYTGYPLLYSMVNPWW
ncbi:hypothetical protein ACFE04_012019 [Oxalis oulophora]